MHIQILDVVSCSACLSDWGCSLLRALVAGRVLTVVLIAVLYYHHCENLEQEDQEEAKKEEGGEQRILQSYASSRQPHHTLVTPEALIRPS